MTIRDTARTQFARTRTATFAVDSPEHARRIQVNIRDMVRHDDAHTRAVDLDIVITPARITFTLGDRNPSGLGETTTRRVDDDGHTIGRGAARRAGRATRRTATRTASNARRFGVELEVVNLDGRRAAAALTAAGIAAAYEGYNHQTRRTWKVVYDSTVPGGCEVVSPPMRSDAAGYAEVKKVCSVLTDAGARVNITTGTHVHVDTDGMDREQIVRFVRSYADNQQHMDTLVSRSRRNGRWARSWDTRTLTAVLDRFAATGTMNADRYHTVNVMSYPRYGTIEFRQHQGTINGDKLVRWIEVLIGLADAAVAGTDVAGDDLLSLLATIPVSETTRRWHYFRAAELAAA